MIFRAPNENKGEESTKFSILSFTFLSQIRHSKRPPYSQFMNICWDALKPGCDYSQQVQVTSNMITPGERDCFFHAVMRSFPDEKASCIRKSRFQSITET